MVAKKTIIKPQIDTKHITPRFAKEDYPGASVGKTQYDLQTNGCLGRRIINFGDGRLSTVFTQGLTTTGQMLDRAAGYNYNPDASGVTFLTGWSYFDPSSSSAIIAPKCGWPSLLSNGTDEMVVAHFREAGGLFASKQTVGAAGQNWEVDDITEGSEAMLWPKTASCQDNYYVIAVDNFTTGIGEMPDIEGLHFYKSENAGADWTYKGILPEFKTYYPYGVGDSYAIDTKGETVAVVVFGGMANTMLWKSTDKGENWTQKVIVNFPIDAFNPWTTSEMIDFDSDGVADTIASTDGVGDVIIDNDGKVHVVFTKIDHVDTTPMDGQTGYFPISEDDGVYYWNEDMGDAPEPTIKSASRLALAVPNQVQQIAYSFDQNGDGVIWDFAEAGTGNYPFGMYGTGMTSQAQLGIDDAGNIYCTFSTVMETSNYVKADANPNPQSYRHVYVSALKKETGEWLTPLLISGDVPLSENAFPAIARKVDENAYIIYQQDNEPGMSVKEDKDAATNNLIIAKRIPVADILAQPALPVGTEDIANTEINVYPNPASEVVYLNNVANAQINIYSITGSLVYSAKSDRQNYEVNIEKFTAGTYLLKVITKEGISTQKLIVK